MRALFYVGAGLCGSLGTERRRLLDQLMSFRSRATGLSMDSIVSPSATQAFDGVGIKFRSINGLETY